MSTRARATSLSAVRHGGLRLPARTRIARLLQAAGARGVLPTVHTDGLWYQDRAFTRPWKYPEDLEKQVEGVLDPSGFPVPVQFGPDLLNGAGRLDIADGWTIAAPSVWSISGGVATCTTGGSSLIRNGVFTVGKKYLISFDVANFTNGTLTLLNLANLQSAGNPSTTGGGKKSLYGVATGVNLQFFAGTPCNLSIDNITVQEVIEDWSWLGPNLVSIDNSWITAGSATVSSGSVALSAAANGAGAYKNYSASLGVGKAYLVVVTVTGYTSGAVTAWLGAQQSSSSNASVSSATSAAFVISPASNWNGNVFVGASTANTTATATITVREIPGHPLIAPSAGAGVTPTARVNLASWTEFEGGLNSTTAPTRGGLVSATSMAGYRGAAQFGHDGVTTSFAYKAVTVVGSTSYKASVDVQMDDGLPPSFGSPSGNGVLNDFALVVAGSTATHLMTSASVRHLGGGVYRVSAIGTVISSPASTNFGVVKFNTNSARTFKVTAYDLRLGVHATSAYPEYQWVRDGTPGVFDYDANGFPVRLEAQASGRGLRSAGTVNFTNTDALHSGAVIVKTSDAAAGMVYEMSPNMGSNNGGIYLIAPSSANIGNYAFVSKGTSPATAVATAAAPVVLAVRSESDISADLCRVFGNEVLSGQAGSDQGTGNYGDHVLNIFGRDLSGTPSLRFTGGMFCTPFIVDGNVVSAADAAEMLRDIARVAGHTY